MSNSFATPRYCAPEQLLGHDAGPAADQYAFGAVLYEMLTGHWLYGAKNFDSMIYLKLNEPPPDVRHELPSLSPAFAWVVQRCLARQPEERFPSMAAVAQALAAIPSSELPVDAQPMSEKTGPAPASDTAELLFLEAVRFAGQQESGKALEYLNIVLHCEPNHSKAKALQKRLRCGLRNANQRDAGDPSRADLLTGQSAPVLTEEQLKVAAHFRIAERDYLKGDYHSALKRLNFVLHLAPGHESALELRWQIKQMLAFPGPETALPEQDDRTALLPAPAPGASPPSREGALQPKLSPSAPPKPPRKRWLLALALLTLASAAALGWFLRSQFSPHKPTLGSSCQSPIATAGRAPACDIIRQPLSAADNHALIHEAQSLVKEHRERASFITRRV